MCQQWGYWIQHNPHQSLLPTGMISLMSKTLNKIEKVIQPVCAMDFGLYIASVRIAWSSRYCTSPIDAPFFPHVNSQCQWEAFVCFFHYPGTLWEDEQTSQRLNKEASFTFTQKMRDNKSTSSSRASSPVQLEATEKMKQVKTRLQLVDLAGSECVGKWMCLFVGMDPHGSRLQ